MRLSHQPQRRARIEMIPLIDCMFLLLVFFIYSMLSMTIHQGIQVNLPVAETGQVDRQTYVAISITRDERLFVNKDEIAFSDLLGYLTMRNGENPDQPVFINADQAVRYQTIIDVLDRVRSAGFTAVSLETREQVDES
jgi:biopolymer transport protein ExbD